MQDKRLTHRLVEYWNQLRGEESLPQWADFNPASFKKIWQQCCGWKIEPGTLNTIVYTYEHIGDSLKKVAGEDRTGHTFKSPQYSSDRSAREASDPSASRELLLIHFQNFPAARILQKMDRTVQRAAIVIEEGRVSDGEHSDIRFRSCLLPFGTGDGVVTHMVLGLSWKKY